MKRFVFLLAFVAVAPFVSAFAQDKPLFPEYSVAPQEGGSKMKSRKMRVSDDIKKSAEEKMNKKSMGNKKEAEEAESENTDEPVSKEDKKTTEEQIWEKYKKLASGIGNEPQTVKKQKTLSVTEGEEESNNNEEDSEKSEEDIAKEEERKKAAGIKKGKDALSEMLDDYKRKQYGGTGSAKMGSRSFHNPDAKDPKKGTPAEGKDKKQENKE